MMMTRMRKGMILLWKMMRILNIKEIKAKIGVVNGTILERTTANLFPEELIGSSYEEVDIDDEELINNEPISELSPTLSMPNVDFRRYGIGSSITDSLDRIDSLIGRTEGDR